MVKIFPIYFLWDMRGGGGANFLTSDGLQIFLGALYHEMVLSSPKHKGSGYVEFLSSELMFSLLLYEFTCFY